MPRSLTAMLLVAILFLAACSVPSTASTAAEAAPAPTIDAPVNRATVETAPSSTAQESTAPALGATATPQQPSPTATVPPANVGTGSGTAIAASSGDLKLVLVPDGTQAEYRVREQFASRNFPTDAVGTTKVVTGAIIIRSDGTLDSAQSRIAVDLATLQSDENRRDNFIKRNTLRTNQYPTATFVLTSVHGLPSPLPTSGDVEFQVIGDMTVHGVTRPTTWKVTGHISGQEMTGQATTAFKFADFDMQIPKVAMLLSVEDNIRLQLDYHLARAS